MVLTVYVRDDAACLALVVDAEPARQGRPHGNRIGNAHLAFAQGKVVPVNADRRNAVGRQRIGQGKLAHRVAVRIRQDLRNKEGGRVKVLALVALVAVTADKVLYLVGNGIHQVCAGITALHAVGEEPLVVELLNGVGHVIVDQVNDTAVNRHDRKLGTCEGFAALARMHRNLRLLARLVVGPVGLDVDVELLRSRVHDQFRHAEQALGLVHVGRVKVVHGLAVALRIAGKGHVHDRHVLFLNRYFKHRRRAVDDADFLRDKALTLYRHQVAAGRNRRLHEDLGSIAHLVAFLAGLHRYLLVVVAIAPVPVGTDHVEAVLGDDIAAQAVR